jgi:hypothetical protein
MSLEFKDHITAIKHKNRGWWALVPQACNPSYKGGRDQEDQGSKPARENSSRDPISKKPFTKIGLVEWLKVKVLSSSPSTTHTHTHKRIGAQTRVQDLIYLFNGIEPICAESK